MIGRVLLIHPSDELYGADRNTLLWARTLRGLGVELDVVLPIDLHYTRELSPLLEGYGCAVQHLDIPILRRMYLNPTGLSALLVKALRSAPALWKLSRRAGLVIGASTVTIPSLLITRASRTPHVIHCQESLGSGSGKLLAVLVWAVSRRIACVSRAIVVSFPAFCQPKCVAVPTGTPPCAASDGGPRLRRQLLGADDHLPIVLLGARLSWWKGQETAIRAFAHPTMRSISPLPVLVLAGGVTPGDEPRLAGLEALAKELGIADRVRVLGHRSDLAELLSAADVVLSTSTRPDPFPVAVLEAMRGGKAVIGTDHGGVPEMLGDTGVLVPPGNEQALAHALAALLGDGARRSALGSAAASRWSELYTEEAARVRLVQFLGSVGLAAS